MDVFPSEKLYSEFMSYEFCIVNFRFVYDLSIISIMGYTTAILIRVDLLCVQKASICLCEHGTLQPRLL